MSFARRILYKKNVRIETCYAGQNIEEIKPVVNIYKITPNYVLFNEELKVDVYDHIIQILIELKRILDKVKPDLVLVEGSSTNSFITALACYHRKIPIGHLGAGFRTYDNYSPYPEEFNRQAISIVAKYNFVPTRKAKLNLIKEGKDSSTIYITGNSEIDVLRKAIRAEYTHPYLEWAKGSRLIFLDCSSKKIDKEAVMAIWKTAKIIVEELKEVKILFPFDKEELDISQVDSTGENDRLLLVPPLSVNDFYNIINQSYFIITDSEEIQIVAPSLGKPVLVIKDDFDNIEGVSVGNLKLVGTNEEDIVRNCKWLVNEQFMYNKMSKVFNPFGDGYASDRIADIILTGRRWEWNERSSSQFDINQ